MRMVRIGYYDKDGKLVREYGEARERKAIMERMYAALDNGMIPVVRDIGSMVRHEPVEDEPEEPVIPVEDKAKEDHVDAGEKLREIIEAMKASMKKGSALCIGGMPGEPPMMVEWKAGEDLAFFAAGRAEDVLDAQTDFLGALAGDPEDEE